MKIPTKLNSLIFGLLLICISGCGSTYGPRGVLGGYEEKEIGKDMIEVRYYGNQHVSVQKTMDRLLYRCAEVTLERGFDSFVLMEDKSHQKESVQDPTINQPFETRQSQSMGTRTVVNPDLTTATASTEWVGVYVIAPFNQDNSKYTTFRASRLDPEKIMKDLAPRIR